MLACSILSNASACLPSFVAPCLFCCAEHNPGNDLLTALAAASEEKLSGFTSQNMSNLVRRQYLVCYVSLLPRCSNSRFAGLAFTRSMYVGQVVQHKRVSPHIMYAAIQVLSYAKLGHHPGPVMVAISNTARAKLSKFTPQVRCHITHKTQRHSRPAHCLPTHMSSCHRWQQHSSMKISAVHRSHV